METGMDKIPMTIQGHKALTEEFRRRTSEDRPAIIAAISEARAHGDLSENAEYSAAKEQQSLNEGRIKELETLLALADIIDVTKLAGDTVKFGATVKIIDEDTEVEKSYTIVGDAEADASKGRISISSPIARALIGKEVGDSIEVAAPGGAKSFEILELKFV
jgi:transcription elongation factor GreA